MHALGYNNSSMSRSFREVSHKMDILFLSILFVGFFSCLIRTDYNFAVIFFCYFIWQQKKSVKTQKLILNLIYLLLVTDLIFAFTQLRVWGTEDPNNQIWQRLISIHNFGIVCFIVILVLKIILAVIIGRYIHQNDFQQIQL